MNKSKMIVIGITGQTGAGKSTVCNIIKKHFNAYVIDADEIAKEVITNKNIKKNLIEQFGENIVSKDGLIVRKSLANIAFSSKDNTKKLNSIMLPEILNKIKAEVIFLKSKNNNIIILDSPLLFESGANKFCNVTISVVATKKVRLKRIIKRDNLLICEAKKRIDIQNNEEFFTRKSDYILNGNEEKEELCKNSINLINNILEVQA